MSHVTHARAVSQEPAPRPPVAALSALLALLATAAVVLVLAIDGGSSGTVTSAGARQQPALRVDGGPDEAAVAATVGSHAATSAGPEETAVGMSISRAAPVPQYRTGGPDESAVASAVQAVRHTAVPDRKSARGFPSAGASVTFRGRRSRMLAPSKRMAAAR